MKLLPRRRALEGLNMTWAALLVAGAFFKVPPHSIALIMTSWFLMNLIMIATMIRNYLDHIGVPDE